MTQLAQYPHEPMVRYSKRHISDSQFVDQTQAGDLLGITAEDEGVYVQEATAEVYCRDLSFKTRSAFIVTHLVPEQDHDPDFDVVFTTPEGKTIDEVTQSFKDE